MFKSKHDFFEIYIINYINIEHFTTFINRLINILIIAL